MVPPVASWLVKKDRAHKHPKARGRGRRRRRRRRRVGRRAGGPSHFRSQSISPQKASAHHLHRHSPVIRRVTAWRNMGTCRSARYSTVLICHPLVRVNLTLQRPSQWGPDVSKSEERAPGWFARGRAAGRSQNERPQVVRYECMTKECKISGTGFQGGARHLASTARDGNTASGMKASGSRVSERERADEYSTWA